MGKVIDVGSAAKGTLNTGGRVVIRSPSCAASANIASAATLGLRTDQSKEEPGRQAFGHTTAGLFGYIHLTRGYPGGQAEYLLVPFADTTHVRPSDKSERPSF